jgi:sodium/hydrogen antiporter
MNHLAIVVIAVIILGFGTISRRLDGSVVTAPMIFVAIGLTLGPHALGVLTVDGGEKVMHILAEVTLVIVLFGDASRIDLRALRRELGLPVRLLGVGLPLCIGLGAVAAKLVFPEYSWLEAGVLAAVLAPTDAALGQAVVSSPVVPLRIRQALNVESGLNDGIALPVVMLLSALGSMQHAHSKTAAEWATFAGMQVTLGPLAGVLVGLLGAKIVLATVRRGWMSGSFVRLSGLSLALLAFAGAELIGGNGFIAAFVAGMAYGNVARERCEELHEFLEAEGQLLMLLVFLLLGSALLWPALSHATARVWLYALMSLTVIRMLPAALSLVGSGVRKPTMAFVGWFGPRGLASVLFAILIVSEADLPHGHHIFAVTMVTVAASVLAHGLSAAPLATRYGRLAKSPTHCPAEHEDVSAHPTRLTGTR